VIESGIPHESAGSGGTLPVWLLGVGGVPSSNLTKEVLMEACEFALNSWQVLPSIWQRMQKWAGPGIADLPVMAPVRNRLVSMQTMARIQHVLLERYVAELERRHIPYVLLKGDAARVLCYDHVYDRCGVDVDIGIPNQCIKEAELIAIDQGFVQAEWDARSKRFYPGSACRRAQVESRHYELGFLARDQVIRDLDEETISAIRHDLPYQEAWHEDDRKRLACYVTFDLHHGLTLDCNLDGALSTARMIVQDGVSFRVPSHPWILFHIIHKLYLEGVATYRTGGFQYADLVRLVAQLGKSEASRLVTILSKHTMEIPAFYVLRRLPSEFEIQLSPPLQELVSRHRRILDHDTDAYIANDFGDMWHKLWGYR
jgi:hypothetical protein